jgi:hypothetical protein
MAKFNLSKLTSKAKDLVDKNGDKIAGGVDKVTNKIDAKTKGKYHDKLEKVDAAAAKLDKSAKADAEPAAEAAPASTPDPAPAPAAADEAPATGGTADSPAAAADFPEPS